MIRWVLFLVLARLRLTFSTGNPLSSPKTRTREEMRGCEEIDLRGTLVDQYGSLRRALIRENRANFKLAPQRGVTPVRDSRGSWRNTFREQFRRWKRRNIWLDRSEFAGVPGLSTETDGQYFKFRTNATWFRHNDGTARLLLLVLPLADAQPGVDAARELRVTRDLT